MVMEDILICHRSFPEPVAIPFRAHAHHLWEFLFIAKGKVVCMIEGKKYLISENTVVVLKPAQVHRIYASGNSLYEYYSLIYNETLISDSFAAWMESNPGIFALEENSVIHKAFWELNRLAQDAYNGLTGEYGLRLVAEVQALLLQTAITAQPPIVAKEDAVLDKAICYIEENICSISCLDEICRTVGVSREGLYQRFIHNMMISPMKYVRAKKKALAQMQAQNEKNTNENILK